MLVDRFNELRSTFLEESDAIAAIKRKDYTNGSEDVLANFKRVGAAAGVDPMIVWLVYFLKHVDAVSMFVRSGEATSEPIEQRFVDLVNYIIIGHALLSERNDEKIRM